MTEHATRIAFITPSFHTLGPTWRRDPQIIKLATPQISGALIANGYQRTMPCPFKSQGLLLNSNGALFYCENSKEIGNVRDTPAGDLYYQSENLAHRATFADTICRNCLSPCQVNVGAMKQFVPYAKFLKRAYQVKKDPERHLDTMPVPEQVR